MLHMQWMRTRDAMQGIFPVRSALCIAIVLEHEQLLSPHKRTMSVSLHNYPVFIFTQMKILKLPYAFSYFSINVCETDTLMNFPVCITKNRQKKFITHRAIPASSSALSFTGSFLQLFLYADGSSSRIVRALRNLFLFLLTVTTGEGYLMMIDSAKADL